MKMKIKMKTGNLIKTSLAKKAQIAWAVISAFLINTTSTFANERLSIADAPVWTSTNSFRDWILSVINWFLSFLWLVAMAVIIYAGFRMVISNWDEEEFGSAKTQIVYAIIGLVVVILSYTIVTLVTDFNVQ